MKKLILILVLMAFAPLLLVAQSSDIALNEVIHWDCETFSPSTGAIVAADSTPTFDVLEEATDAPIVTGSMTARSGYTGKYRGTTTLSAANGFDVGKWYTITCYATVETITGDIVKMHFRVGPAENQTGVPQWAYIIRTGTAQAGAATTITLDSGASSSDSFYLRSGAVVAIVSGTGAGQSRKIIKYVGSTKVATVDTTWVTNPNSTSVFVLFPGK